MNGFHPVRVVDVGVIGEECAHLKLLPQGSKTAMAMMMMGMSIAGSCSRCSDSRPPNLPALPCRLLFCGGSFDALVFIADFLPPIHFIQILWT